MRGIRLWISANSSFASVVIIANVQIHSPEGGSFSSPRCRRYRTIGGPSSFRNTAFDDPPAHHENSMCCGALIVLPRLRCRPLSFLSLSSKAQAAGSALCGLPGHGQVHRLLGRKRHSAIWSNSLNNRFDFGRPVGEPCQLFNGRLTMPRTLNLAAMCDWLLFGSGGIAFASAELHAPLAFLDETHFFTGYAAGGGVEYAWDPNIRFRME